MLFQIQKMVKIVLESREDILDIEDRLASSIQDFIANCSWLQTGQEKTLRTKLAQVIRKAQNIIVRAILNTHYSCLQMSSCFVQKVVFYLNGPHE